LSCKDKNGCNGCYQGADKQTDTVRIHFDNLGEKENVFPKTPNAAAEHDALEQQKKMKEEQEKQRRDQEEREEQERQRQEQEQKLKEEQEEMRRQAEEQRRHAEEQRLAKELAEEQERLRCEAEQAELRRRQAEELLRQEEERRRKEEENRRAEAETKRRAEIEEKQAKLNAFLKSADFQAVNEKKKKSGIVSSSFTYPLHAAVKANNLEAVQLLVWAGANKSLKDNNKMTPEALAQKLNKKDSHKAILDVLSQ